MALLDLATPFIPSNPIAPLSYRRVCDIGFDHASISSQHCVLQYRQVVKQNEYGETSQKVKLYIIDLESSNGTHVNSEHIPSSRYYELKVGDVIKLGHSTRELVLMSYQK